MSKITKFTAQELIQKAKELKDHLKFINRKDSLNDYGKSLINPNDCFYSSQISRQPN